MYKEVICEMLAAVPVEFIIREVLERDLVDKVNDWKGYKVDKNVSVEEFVGSIDDVQRGGFMDYCSLDVTVGSTGLKGGDAGHGGKTFVTFENQYSTAMMVAVNGSNVLRDAEKITIAFAGDAELRNFVEGLRFALSELERALKV